MIYKEAPIIEWHLEVTNRMLTHDLVNLLMWNHFFSMSMKPTKSASQVLHFPDTVFSIDIFPP